MFSYTHNKFYSIVSVLIDKLSRARTTLNINGTSSSTVRTIRLSLVDNAFAYSK